LERLNPPLQRKVGHYPIKHSHTLITLSRTSTEIHAHTHIHTQTREHTNTQLRCARHYHRSQSHRGRAAAADQNEPMCESWLPARRVNSSRHSAAPTWVAFESPPAGRPHSKPAPAPGTWTAAGTLRNEVSILARSSANLAKRSSLSRFRSPSTSHTHTHISDQKLSIRIHTYTTHTHTHTHIHTKNIHT
jgi:hypothetical protein